MLGSVCTVVLTAVLGAGPYQQVGGYYGAHAPAQEQYGAAVVVADNYPGAGLPAYGGGGAADQLYPYDSPEPWLHGYFQEIPAYGGYGAFRPYNYKHVLSQSQAAGGWGMAPTMPYSQQFWHRYHQQAALANHVSRVGATTYAAELAKLRAKYDFEKHQASGFSRRASHQRSPASQPPTTPQEIAGKPGAVVPAGYQQPGAYQPVDSALERMRNQLNQQNAKVQALQQQLRQQEQPRRGLLGGGIRKSGRRR
jgi:hypothetical protein